MQLHELAAELRLGTPEIVEFCRVRGINASWAGAELTEADVEQIRWWFQNRPPPTQAPQETPPPAAWGVSASTVVYYGPPPEIHRTALDRGRWVGTVICALILVGVLILAIVIVTRANG